MLQTCSEGLCCRVLHFIVPLPPLEPTLDFFGLLCVALCYTILYCNMLKCIDRAVKYLSYCKTCVWFHCLLDRGRICQERFPVHSASDGGSQTVWNPERGRAVRPTSGLIYILFFMGMES